MAQSRITVLYTGDHHEKISTRNQLKGKIVDTKPGATTSHVSIDIGQGSILMASIINEAEGDLGLKVGDDAWAIIKASNVLRQIIGRLRLR
jgi:molybdopterin-binding protein